MLTTRAEIPSRFKLFEGLDAEQNLAAGPDQDHLRGSSLPRVGST